MPDAVLVIDMVRGFFEAAHDGETHNLYLGDDARALIPKVRRVLETELERGSQLIFLCDHHQPDDREFEVFAPHCVIGTPETEVIPELRDLPGDVVPKNRYSAFFGTDLDRRLNALRPGRVLICGVCTDICVLHTASDARNRDYRVEVPEDCVASFSEENHRWGLKHLREILGAQVVART
jgi:nicotinamidase-related amidase